jgi:signal transduction histidine kinase
MENVSNKTLLDEFAKRLNQNTDTTAVEEIARLEEETRQLGMRLRESENGKSQFLSNVRNEINNPLSAIMGLAASISGLSSEEKIRHMSQLIERQAAELDFQMRNIIMAAEIEAGELTKSCSRVDVQTIVENQIAYLRHRISDHGTNIELSMDEQLKFRTDANILQIICLNLFSNAIEYCGSNKIVMIDVERKIDHLELSVRDFGSGIEPVLQSEIFQRFKQGETGLKKKHCGHGLGLCIVKELTNYLNGSIQLDSLAGRGTTVKVTIPEMPLNELAENTLNFGGALLFTEDETF